MIAEIGVMVGLYIITRMLSFILRKEKRAENIAVKILAVITIIVTIIVIADLLIRGLGISSPRQVSTLFHQEPKASPVTQKDIENLCEKVRSAHLNKDIQKWLSCYTPNYPKLGQLENSILELWRNNDIKEVSYLIHNVQRQGDRQARAVVTWSFQIYDHRHHDYQLLRQKYQITLEQVNGDWKIRDSKEDSG